MKPSERKKKRELTACTQKGEVFDMSMNVISEEITEDILHTIREDN